MSYPAEKPQTKQQQSPPPSPTHSANADHQQGQVPPPPSPSDQYGHPAAVVGGAQDTHHPPSDLLEAFKDLPFVQHIAFIVCFVNQIFPTLPDLAVRFCFFPLRTSFQWEPTTQPPTNVNTVRLYVASLPFEVTTWQVAWMVWLSSGVVPYDITSGNMKRRDGTVIITVRACDAHRVIAGMNKRLLVDEFGVFFASTVEELRRLHYVCAANKRWPRLCLSKFRPTQPVRCTYEGQQTYTHPLCSCADCTAVSAAADFSNFYQYYIIDQRQVTYTRPLDAARPLTVAEGNAAVACFNEHTIVTHRTTSARQVPYDVLTREVRPDSEHFFQQNPLPSSDMSMLTLPEYHAYSCCNQQQELKNTNY